MTDFSSYVQNLLNSSYGTFESSLNNLNKQYGQPRETYDTTETSNIFPKASPCKAKHQVYYEDGKKVATAHQNLPTGYEDDYRPWTYNRIDYHQAGLSYNFNPYFGNSIENHKLGITIRDTNYNNLVDESDTIIIDHKKMTIKDYLNK